MGETMQIAEAFHVAMEFAVASGAENIKDLPGCWSGKVDEHWSLKCNGHDHKIDGVPPYCFYIEFNGWPAGIIAPNVGTIAAGKLANEETFISACLAATRKLKEGERP